MCWNNPPSLSNPKCQDGSRTYRPTPPHGSHTPPTPPNLNQPNLNPPNNLLLLLPSIRSHKIPSPSMTPLLMPNYPPPHRWISSTPLTNKFTLSPLFAYPNLLPLPHHLICGRPSRIADQRRHHVLGLIYPNPLRANELEIYFQATADCYNVITHRMLLSVHAP